MEKIIHQTIVDEGETTLVMYISGRKDLGSPLITPSPAILTTFNGHSFSLMKFSLLSQSL